MIESVVWQIKSPMPRSWRCTQSGRRNDILYLIRCCVCFSVQLHQCEVPVHSLSHLRSYVLLCLGGWVHGRPCSVHRSVSRATARSCTIWLHCQWLVVWILNFQHNDVFLSFPLVCRGHPVYRWVWTLSGGHRRTDVLQSNPGAGLPTSRHG